MRKKPVVEDASEQGHDTLGIDEDLQEDSVHHDGVKESGGEPAKQYFQRKPKAPLAPIPFASIISGIRCSFLGGSSVFSKGRIDPGTHELIETAFKLKGAGTESNEPGKTPAAAGVLFAEHPGLRVLDLGCGIGSVGVFMKRRFPRIEIVLTDVNTRALRLAKQNMDRNGIRREGFEAFESDGFKAAAFSGRHFDLILFNPPQHAGKQVCLRLITESAAHCAPGGVLLLVARHNRGGKTLADGMREAYGNVSSAGKRGVFRVYRADKLPA